MTTRTAGIVGDLRAFIADFAPSLRAASKAARTVAIYADAARRFGAFRRPGRRGNAPFVTRAAGSMMRSPATRPTPAAASRSTSNRRSRSTKQAVLAEPGRLLPGELQA